MEREHTKFETPMQDIALKPVDTHGLILDIGGGGEGLVSRIAGSKVCAVDYRLDEIREARIHDPPSNWFVTDGQALPFRDSSFNLATLWFSLEYMRDWSTKKKVLSEAYRALKTSGKISILASEIDCKEDIFVFHVNFILPDGTPVKTGYGVWGGQGQTPETLTALLRELGFGEIEIEENDWWFRIHASKV
ncbi:MAG: class I SAM-dependent methyltransferase [Candidatus Thorarchaeota archaeon]|nr:class I SAM-dependent methyltransferase [Candidatus Thorarchaeota archaeon]